jgi:type IV secretion system protein VirB9
MIRSALALALLFAATAADAQDASAADPRIQTMPYDAGRVVPLRVAPRHQLTLMFAAGERIENVAIGDADAWQITANNRADALFIKALGSTGSSTNMTVITDTRTYSFELTLATAPGFDTPYVMRFTYPDASLANEAGDVPPPTTGRYRLSGARSARPSVIEDDGVRTYVQWAAQQPVPAIFAVDERGAETLLQGQMRDGRFVLDSTHSTLIFRLDGEVARAHRRPPAEAPS